MSEAPAPIRVQYAATRGEIFRWYLRSWATPSRFWVSRLITLGFLTTMVWLVAGRTAWPPARAIATWVVCVLLYVGFVFIYPQLRYRQVERTLEISDAGVESWAGESRAKTPWRKIRDVYRLGHARIMIASPTGIYVIPRRAFETDADMDRFFVAARAWQSSPSAAQGRGTA